MKITPSYQYIEESRNTRSYDDPWLTERVEQLNIFSVNADLEKSNPVSDFIYGGEILFNNVSSEAEVSNVNNGEKQDAPTRYPSEGSQYYAGAAYLTHKIRPGRFILEQGVRLSYTGLKADLSDTSFYKFDAGEIKQDNVSLSGVLGFKFNATEKMQFNVTGSSGFRAPNIDDLAKIFDSNPGSVIIPNSDLDAEKTINAEFGIAYRDEQKLNIQAIIWQTWYEDVIITEAGELNGQDSIIYDGTLSQVLVNTNAGKAILNGWTVGISAKVSSTITAEGSVTGTYGTITSTEEDEPLDHIPPLFGKAGVQFQKGKVRLKASVHFNGEKALEDYGISGEDNLRYATPDGTPSWHTYNFSGEVRLSNRTFVQLNIENIADYHYRVFASGVSAPGRNIIVSLRSTF